MERLNWLSPNEIYTGMCPCGCKNFCKLTLKKYIYAYENSENFEPFSYAVIKYWNPQYGWIYYGFEYFLN